MASSTWRLAHFGTFFLVAIGILTGIHCYFWVRLVRDTQIAAPFRTWASCACVALALSVPLSLMAPRILPRSFATGASWPGYIWLGWMLLLLFCLIASEAARGIWDLVGWALTGHGLLPAQRVLQARALALVALVVSGTACVWSIRAGLSRPVVRELRIALPNLPPALEGKTIVQLSDLHIGATKRASFADEVVQQTNALAPDAIVLTGDVVEGRFGGSRADVAPLANLRAPWGVFMVTGNHEYYSGVRQWLPYLQLLGIRILRNEHVELGSEDGCCLDLAGIDDWRSSGMEPGHGPNIPRALAGRDPSHPVILLSHQPAAIDEAAHMGVSLVLSGHTHGGQIWPFTYLVRLQQPFVRGFHRIGDTQLYINPGTGYWGPPMRLGTRPEITRITLMTEKRRARAGEGG